MEWAPKFLDTLDSLAFEFRMRFAGYVGWSIRRLVLLIALLVLAVLNPVARDLVVAMIVTFGLAELVSSRFRRSRYIDQAPARRKAVIKAVI